MVHGIYAVVDLNLVTGDIDEITEGIIDGGAGCIQLRAKEVSTREFAEASNVVARICRQNKILFIINDRVDLALALNSDGVHLGQDDMPVSIARKLVTKGKLIGLSVHSIDEARKATEEKPDYIGVGPVFFTRTKANAASPVGTELISEIKNVVDLPLVAIGGINGENIAQVVKAGADAVAVCSAILTAVNIKIATENLVSQYRQAQDQRGSSAQNF